MLNVSFWWSVNTGESMCRSPLKNVAYKFIFVSSSTQHFLLAFLGQFGRLEVCGRTATVLWCAASRVCSKYHISFLCSSRLAFIPSISLETKWFCYIVVLTWLQIGRIPMFFIRDNIYQ